MADLSDMQELLAVICIKIIAACAVLAGLWIVVGHLCAFLIEGLGRVVRGVEHVADGTIGAIADAFGVVPNVVWGAAGTALLVIFVLFVAAVALAMALQAMRTARAVDMSDSKNILLHGPDGVTAISFVGADIRSKVVEEVRRKDELTPAEVKILEKMYRRQIGHDDRKRLEKGGSA